MQIQVHRKESDSAFMFFVKRALIGFAVSLIVSFWIVSPALPSGDEDIKTVAKSLSQEIERAQFHKVYVADFLDSSGPTEKAASSPLLFPRTSQKAPTILKL